MKKKFILLSLLIVILLLAVGCQNETQLIGLRRLEYKPKKSILHVYYFADRSSAENYFREKDLQDYFLFEVQQKDTRKLFNKLDGEELEKNKKKLVFNKDENNTAIEKVVNLIDENNMLRVAGPN